MAKVADIVTKLWQRSNQHKIRWEPTADDYVFLAAIGDSSSVTIAQYRDRNRIDEVRFRILDERGRELEDYDTAENENEAIKEKLIEIYAEARRTALDIDNHLNELLQELEKE
ncbi:MAG TPA: hypothetical protein VFR55_13475 [Dehalococcoidia bacterium]|nr:hypothetical protein [Dehalococcoidia bacterium]